jgi:hypothetical protein
LSGNGSDLSGNGVKTKSPLKSGPGWGKYPVLWCRGWESIPRPRAYESPALPLSYLGKRLRCYYGDAFLSTILVKWKPKNPKKCYLVLDFTLPDMYNKPSHNCLCFCPQWDVACGTLFPPEHLNSGEIYGICTTREELCAYPGYA